MKISFNRWYTDPPDPPFPPNVIGVQFRAPKPYEEPWIDRWILRILCGIWVAIWMIPILAIYAAFFIYLSITWSVFVPLILTLFIIAPVFRQWDKENKEEIRDEVLKALKDKAS